MIAPPPLKVSSISFLSLLLKQPARLQGATQFNPLDMRTITAELDAAPTVAEKLLILERLLRQQEVAKSAPNEENSLALPEEGLPVQAWKVSEKSVASMNELHYQQYGRQWEAESIIKAVIEHVHLGQSDVGVGEAAIPFKPSAADMEKAIEALGYSSRKLIEHDYAAHQNTYDVAENSGQMLRIALIVLVGLFVGAILFSA